MKINYGIRTLLVATSLVAILTSSCMSREEAFGKNPQTITFNQPVEYSMPDIRQMVEKRGFNDFTCDGLTDMVEINNTKFFAQDYNMKIFPGYLNIDGVIQFSDKSYIVDLPLKKDWFIGTPKFDTADVNNDGCADISLTEYNSSWDRDNVVMKVAINNGNGKSFNFYDAGNLESKVSDKFNTCTAWVDSDYFSDYVKFDWVNVDGIFGDDPIFMCKSVGDLIVDVIPVVSVTDNKIIYGETQSIVIQNFLIDRYVNEIDTEAFNNDKIGDIILPYNYFGTRNYSVSIALGEVVDGKIKYNIERDTPPITMPSFAYLGLGFDKIDFYEADGRFGADFAMIGWKSKGPVVIYAFEKVK